MEGQEDYKRGKGREVEGGVGYYWSVGERVNLEMATGEVEVNPTGPGNT